MRTATLRGFAPQSLVKSASHLSATILLASCVLMLCCAFTAAPAQETKPAAPAAAPTPPTAPSPGKALIYIYRPGKFVGSAAHDHLYINGVYVAYLLNGEYAWLEVDPGTAVVTGMPEMYYAGGVAMSSYAAIKDNTKKENERIRLDVEAGKTYYLKWTSGTLATGIKVTLMDADAGAKEMSKLHPSKAVVQPEAKKGAGGDKEGNKQETK